MSQMKVLCPRYLHMDLPPGQTAFLWGARNTGKSTYLKEHFPDAIYYDFLKSDIVLRFSKEPHLFREEILTLPKTALSQPIIIDEVQKIPALLDEIHWLIENAGASFILCGSSARKLKRQSVNLLGGRAWRFTFYPLVYPEIPDLDLLHVLNTGLIPSHYFATSPKHVERSLRAYIQDYLKHEIQEEGLTRNLPAFARFLDALAFSQGELTNFTDIARECAIDAKTVKEYHQILIDTLLGYFIYPYTKKISRDIITATPKFYLFDLGVANILMNRTIGSLKGEDAGHAFEHFILTELIAFRGLNEMDFDINFWRTKTGLEVDFILERGKVAIEVKIGTAVRKSDLKGLITFQEEHQPQQAYVVSLDPRPRKILLENNQEIMVLPWQIFLKKLWAREII